MTPAATIELVVPTARRRANRWATHGSIIVSDGFAIFAAFAAAVIVRQLLTESGQLALLEYWRFLPLLLGFPVVYKLTGLYPGLGLNPIEELRRVVHANTTVYLLMVASTFLTKAGALYSRLAFIGAWILSILLVVLCRNMTRHALARKSWWGVPVIVLGAGATGQGIVAALRRYPALGLKVAFLLDDDPAKQTFGNPPDGHPPVLGDLSLTPSLAKSYGVRYAILAMPNASPERFAAILASYAHQFPHFLVVPDFLGYSTLWVTAKDFGGVLGLEISQNLLHRIPQISKRALDILGALLIGIPLLPLFLLVVALIRLTSSGAAIYTQQRIGHNGRRFRAYKLRSMYQHGDQILAAHLVSNEVARREWDQMQKIRNDPRVTPVGRFLRKTSFDELPQLWNILMGQMSLVGPRPILEREIPIYGEAIELYNQVRPGLTGLWQVSGRNNVSFEGRVQFDEYYVRNWSVWLDAWILGRTVRAVVKGEGAWV